MIRVRIAESRLTFALTLLVLALITGCSGSGAVPVVQNPPPADSASPTSGPTDPTSNPVPTNSPDPTPPPAEPPASPPTPAPSPVLPPPAPPPVVTPPPPPPSPPPITIAVVPSAVTLATQQTQRFIAQVANTTNTAVTWQVDGISGGNAAV